MEPILRWVGSKRWALNDVIPIVTSELYPNGRLWEPFCGGASIFFGMNGKCNAVLCDAIETLILTYHCIQTNPIEVWRYAKDFAQDGNNQDRYNELRIEFNKYIQGKIKNFNRFAGLFIYLNRTCFNGLWRQNANGEFNVPFGDVKRIRIPSQAELLRASLYLKKAELHTIYNHREVVELIRTKPQIGDVIFADPPYIETFDDYEGMESASAAFQEELANALWQANLKGITVIAMNSDDDRIRRWYGAFCEIIEISRHQGISGTREGRGQWQQILMIAK